MPQFLFAYHGGKRPEGPEEFERMMTAWSAWFADMGDAVVDPGNPVGRSITATKDGVIDNGGAAPVSGYTVVSADTIEAAAALARACPMVVAGDGTIEVAEVTPVDL